MINFFSKFFILCIVVFIGATATQAEEISKFSADYSVSDTGEVFVTEIIDYDFGELVKHGIFRIINNKHPQKSSVWYKNRFIDISLLSVTRNGESEEFTVEDLDKKVNIKIGKEDAILTGKQTFIITYTLTGALSYGDQGAEFYYNVTGNDWEVPIKLAVATVRGQKFRAFYCYQGPAYATDSCTNSEKGLDEVTFTSEYLPPGDGLTIATEFSGDKVSVIINEETTFLLFGYALASVWFLLLGIYVYRFRYKNYTKKTVIAQYEPYRNFLPMYTGYLYDNSLDPRDITAGVLYLAEQGFIKISLTNIKVFLIIPTTDYNITLLRPLSEIPTNFLKKVSELLFINEVTVGTVVSISVLAKKRHKNSELIEHLKRDMENDLKENGFLELTYSIVIAKVPGVFGILLIIFGSFIFIPNGIFLIEIVLIGTFLIGSILLIPRKTVLWYEAENHIAGFQLFLSLADKQRFAFHNAPEKSPELFMKYLPYAVALGVEEKWSEVFKDITIAQPDWYEGGNMAVFSAGNLASDLGAFSTALSSNSGVSGSSGGGRSGGGGGGGGGGSW